MSSLPPDSAPNGGQPSPLKVVPSASILPLNGVTPRRHNPANNPATPNEELLPGDDNYRPPTPDKRSSMATNSLGLGLLIGLVVPLIVYFFFYFWKFNGYSMNSYYGALRLTSMMTKVLSIGAVANLLPFWWFTNREQYNGVRGVLIATVVVGVIIALDKFIPVVMPTINIG